ncbi:MAG: proton-conducting membrane transporter [Pseudonocardiales bacterium]|nr:MAG: proton-conducting membrane transporter [Pseudonocardiales bacterium]
MTAQDVVFGLLGVIALGSALLVVTTRNVVRAALWLVVTFGAVAGCYLVLTAELVAWVQVLIYIGAIVVLLLFGVMLTRAPIGPTDQVDSGNRRVAVLVGLATAAMLVTLVLQAFHSTYVTLDQPGTASLLGAAVFRSWVLPLEVLSVLLLTALVGAITLTRPTVGTAGSR